MAKAPTTPKKAATAATDPVTDPAVTDASGDATAQAGDAAPDADGDASDGDTSDVTDPVDPALASASVVPDGFVRMVHTDATDHSGVSFGGTTYLPGDDGSIVVPGTAAEVLKSHGFKQA